MYARGVEGWDSNPTLAGDVTPQNPHFFCEVSKSISEVCIETDLTVILKVGYLLILTTAIADGLIASKCGIRGWIRICGLMSKRAQVVSALDLLKARTQLSSFIID